MGETKVRGRFQDEKLLALVGEDLAQTLEEFSEKYEACGPMLIVRRVSEFAEEMLAPGLVKPDVMKERSQRGVVVAAGAGEYSQGTFMPNPYREGDLVVFTKYGGTSFQCYGLDLEFIHMRQVYLRER